jgi:hypothetical protein
VGGGCNVETVGCRACGKAILPDKRSDSMTPEGTDRSYMSVLPPEVQPTPEEAAKRITLRQGHRKVK